MFRIGEFAQFSRVSVKTLRHYDEIGLLPPAQVDPFTHYRYYSAAQLPRLQRILALREMGFGLAQIGQMLEETVSSEELLGMLKLRRAEIQARIRQEQRQLAAVEARLARFQQTAVPPSYAVRLRAVEPLPVASIRQAMTDEAPSIKDLFETLESVVARQNGRRRLPPLMLHHVWSDVNAPEEVEVAVPVQGEVVGDGRIQTRTLPGHRQMASVIHAGSYDTMTAALAALLHWIEAHDFQIDGPLREVYLRFGADQADYTLPDGYLAATNADYITELQIPVRK